MRTFVAWSRLTAVRWMTALSLSLAFLTTGCGSNDGDAPPQGPGIAPPPALPQPFVAEMSRALQDVQGELRTSLSAQERALAAGLPDSPQVVRLTTRIERLQKLVGKAVAEAPAPKAEPSWDFSILQEQLKGLIAKAETLEGRGDVEWHYHAAKFNENYAHAQDCLRSLDPKVAAILPENKFLLLDSTTLNELKTTWSRHRDIYKTYAASDPTNLNARLVQQAESKLSQIDDALKNPANLSERFAALPNKPPISEELVARLKENPEIRAQNLAEEEKRLIRKSLAQDASDEAARRRLDLLEGKNSDLSLREKTGKIVIERTRALSPQEKLTPQEATSRNVKDLLTKRFDDPIRAAELEASLTQQWEIQSEIAGKGNPAITLDIEHRQSAPRWMVSQLTDADLAEAKALARQAEDYVKLVEASHPEAFPSKANTYDLSIIQEEIKAIDAERAFRDAHQGRPSVPEIDLAQLDAPTRARLDETLRTSPEDLMKTPEGRQHLLDARERYCARAVEPLPAAIEARNSLRIKATEIEVVELIKDHETYRKLRQDYTESGFAEDPAQKETISKQLKEMQESLDARTERLKAGLKETSAYAPEESAELTTRLDKAVKESRWTSRKSHVVLDLAMLDNPPRPPDGDGWPKPPPDGPPPSTPPNGEGPKPAGSDGRPSGNGPKTDGPKTDGPGPIGEGPDSPGPKGNGPKPPGGNGASVADNGPSRPAPRFKPIGDPIYEPLKMKFQTAMEKASGLITDLNTNPNRPAAPPTNGEPYVAIDSNNPNANDSDKIYKATKGQRPDMKGWGEKGRFEEIDNLKSMKIMPGGVALGKVAEVEGNWKDATLVYVPDEGLTFIKPSGERVKLPAVDPAILKTCYLYARSKDSVAISIGYDGERDNPLDRNALSPVLIHPVLRDTQVGLDVINADRLPWSLRAEKLPNGVANPVVNELRDLVTKAGDPLPGLPVNPLLDRLRKVADVAETGKSPERVERLRKTAVGLLDNSTRLDSIMLAVAEADETEEARFQAFIRLENETILKSAREEEKKAIEAAKSLTDERRVLLLKQNETLGLDEFYKPEQLVKMKKDQEKCRVLFKSMAKDRFEAIQRLLIMSVASNDREVPWRFVMAATLLPAASSEGSGTSLQELAPQVLLLMQHARLSLLTDESVQLKLKKSGDEMVFATRLKIRYIHGQVEAGENGLKRTDDVHESAPAGEKATSLIPQLEVAFPPLKKTVEYASWIALMRWAIQKGNVGSLDLADLGSVAHTTRPTPDYLIRGSRSEVNEALEELGVNVKP